jgi:dihydrolipoamide dehydrogenase
MAVTLVDADPLPGGVCLHRGCIPSKALLHVAQLVHESRAAADWGVRFAPPAIDLDALRAWKQGVVDKHTRGLGTLARARRVTYLQGLGHFEGPHTLHVRSDGQVTELEFDYAIVATGSTPAIPPPLRLDSPRVLDSTSALALPDIPGTLLVVGGGYIGLELGSVYAALGSRVTVVEMTGGLLPGADRDLVQVLERRLRGELEAILLDTRVAALEDSGDAVRARLTSAAFDEVEHRFDRVLIATGRTPNARHVGLETTGAQLDARGFVVTDAQRRTAEPSIYAIGDVAGEPMLAHKAAHEARVAVEAIAGKPAAFAPAAIPAVVFTDPEIAWTGLTETQARERGIAVETSTFPWGASGRATTMGRSEGLTKLVIEPGTQRILGVGIAGTNAGELAGEATLAVELGATVPDLHLTVHAHPTLAETLMEAASLYLGHSPHYLRPRSR